MTNVEELKRLAKNAEYSRKWRMANKEKHLWYNRNYRKNNPEKEREARRRYRLKNKDKKKILEKNRRKRLQEYKNGLKQRGCIICGETAPPCLDFHHVDRKTKEGTVGVLSTYSKKRMIIEASKCVILCANCHRKLHSGLYFSLICSPSARAICRK